MRQQDQYQHQERSLGESRPVKGDRIYQITADRWIVLDWAYISGLFVMGDHLLMVAASENRANGTSRSTRGGVQDGLCES